MTEDGQQPAHVPDGGRHAGHPDIAWHEGAVARDARVGTVVGLGATVLMTGLSGSGKSTIAAATEQALVASGTACYRLDGDNVRHGLNGDLGFSPSDRSENIRRIGEVARLLADAGLVVLVPVIAPYRADRQRLRMAHRAARLPFSEVFVDTPLEVVEERDPKGLYARARAGELTGMTGVDAPYEVPRDPDLVLSTTTHAVAALVDEVIDHVVTLRARARQGPRTTTL